MLASILTTQSQRILREATRTYRELARVTQGGRVRYGDRKMGSTHGRLKRGACARVFHRMPFAYNPPSNAPRTASKRQTASPSRVGTVGRCEADQQLRGTWALNADVAVR